ncbi:hypothetical protein PtB15_12B493 [Puccinia triticina]|nr:hypothetical protein PtB15_12B493 [Puccinia triticina]
MCKEAPQEVVELKHFCMPFLRTKEGKINQQAFGVQLLKYSKGRHAYQCASAANWTSHAILHTLYGQSVRCNTNFCVEFFALDWIEEDADA